MLGYINYSNVIQVKFFKAPRDCGKTMQAMESLKEIRGRSWNGDTKSWDFQGIASAHQIEEILSWSVKHDISITETFKSLVEKFISGKEEKIEGIKARINHPALFLHQKEGALYLAERKSALLADDMGLGKTLQAIVALPEPADCGVIVLCPNSAKPVWRREFAKWRNEFRVEVLKGKGSFRFPTKGEVIVINYDILPSEYSAKPDFPVFLIVDEIHYLKNRKTKRAKNAEALKTLCSSVWGMTGTPMARDPVDFYSILSFLSLTSIFGGWNGYCKEFRGYKGRYGYTWGSPTERAGELCAKVMLRRKQVDVMDLPGEIEETRIVNNLSPKLRKKLDESLKTWEEWEAAKKQVEDSLSAGLPPFEMFSQIRADLAAAKTDHALELAEEFEESGEPVVFFSCHRDVVDALAAREGWLSITGDISSEKRGEIETRFQTDSAVKGIAMTIQAGHAAITLTRARYMVFVDLDWNPDKNQQAKKRIKRIGQKATCYYIYLQADHEMDKRVCELLSEKQNRVDNSIEKANRVQYNPNEQFSEIKSLLSSISLYEPKKEVIEEKPVLMVKKELVDLEKPNAVILTLKKESVHHTFKIVKGTSDFGEGKWIVYLLTGSDNENDYTGVAFMDGKAVSTWKRQAHHDAKVKALWACLTTEQTEWEVLASICCRCCKRRLTTPESIALGIGPECMSKEMVG